MIQFHRNERAASLPARLSRSWLLVSGASSEETIAAALESEADSVIIDLEDGCPPDQKEAARQHTVEMLNASASAWVRVNGNDSPYWKDDLAALNHAKGLKGVMLAMAEDPDQVTRTAMMLPAGTPVIALIETALGMVNAVAIAKAPGTFRLAFGLGDYRRDTGVSADPLALAPSADEIAWAKELLEKTEGDSVPKDGSYLPRLARARKVSDLAKTYGLWRK